jgi:hypothetical protein
MPDRPLPSTLSEFITEMPSGWHFALTWRAGTPQLVLIDVLWEHHLVELVRAEFSIRRPTRGSFETALLPPFVVELLTWFDHWGDTDRRYPTPAIPNMVVIGEIPAWVADEERYAALVAAAHSIIEPDLPERARDAALRIGEDPLTMIALTLDVYDAAGTLEDAIAASVRALSSTAPAEP